MLKQIVKKTIYLILEKPLPSLSEQETENLSELQKTFKESLDYENNNILPSETIWNNFIIRLRELVMDQNPRKFLRWDIILETMFETNARFVSEELNFLKHCTDWNMRWRKAIEESPVGHPIPYILFPKSSGNLIHHAYHIAQFEKNTGLQVHNMDFIFEFGGGYGSMCRLFFNLGFRGKYIIFDLPSFTALQKYYLKTIGLPLYSLNSFMKSETGIFCLSDHILLREIIKSRTEFKKSMFIATWSLSESPLIIRNTILPLIKDFKSFLIAFQPKFGEIDNMEFFNNWMNENKSIDWVNWQIKHIPGNNYYLFGRNN